MQETQVWSLSWEDPLEKGMATHSSIVAWKTQNGQRSLVGYSPWGHKASDITEPVTLSHFEPLNEPALELLFLWMMLCQILYLTDAYIYEHSNTRCLISADFIACT